MFCSFGLLAAAPIMVVLLVANSGMTVRERAARLALWVLGLLAVYAALRWIGGYDWLVGREYALGYHGRFKAWEDQRALVVHYAFIDALDFGVWIGAPLSLAALLAGLTSLADPWRSLRRTFPLLRLTLAACVVTLLAYGRTKGETGRLWLFLAPFVCLSVASWLHQELSARRRDVMLLVILQAVSVYFIKRFMDFW